MLSFTLAFIARQEINICENKTERCVLGPFSTVLRAAGICSLKPFFFFKLCVCFGKEVILQAIH